MPATFRIHPAIGIARVGNSPTSFYIGPEARGAVPIDCDADGNPVAPATGDFPYKDDQKRIRRQAARFRIYVYDDKSPDGRELKIGDQVTIINTHRGYQEWKVKITDIAWTVYLANKKASWYQFQETDGEHGYGANHPLRNASITKPQDRQRLIIDPGPRTVSFLDPKRRRAEFSGNEAPQTFPPALSPNSITTLGEIRCVQDADGTTRLLVLGGFGNSGSMTTEFGSPKIETFANNDGWFDDLGDGPVTATLSYDVVEISGQPAPPGRRGTVAVDDPAWVIVGYPRYAPQIIDVVTLDDVLFDMAVRRFAYVPYMYGLAPDYRAPDPPLASEQDYARWRDRATWNAAYRPYFLRDIWPILERPLQYQYVMGMDPMFGGDPHDPSAGMPFDPAEIGVPPYEGEPPADRERRRVKRMHIFNMLRKQGRENDLFTAVDLHVNEDAGELARRVARRAEIASAQREHAGVGVHVAAEPRGGGESDRYAMPLLCGDNPITNVAPSKFLRLTDAMLFMLGQWAHGSFINEAREDIVAPPFHPGEAVALDRGVIANLLGGSFCPGGEVSWIIRNPAIFSAPYRLRQAAKAVTGALSHPANLDAGGSVGNAARLHDGLEPGDITKYDALPWQADFNECSTQEIDVTYRDWNAIDPANIGEGTATMVQLTYWWPSHRPMEVSRADGSRGAFSKTSQTNAGDLAMVTAWAQLGFLTPDPQNPPSGLIPGGFICTQE